MNTLRTCFAAIFVIAHLVIYGLMRFVEMRASSLALLSVVYMLLGMVTSTRRTLQWLSSLG